MTVGVIMTTNLQGKTSSYCLVTLQNCHKIRYESVLAHLFHFCLILLPLFFHTLISCACSMFCYVVFIWVQLMQLYQVLNQIYQIQQKPLSWKNLSNTWFDTLIWSLTEESFETSIHDKLLMMIQSIKSQIHGIYRNPFHFQWHMHSFLHCVSYL